MLNSFTVDVLIACTSVLVGSSELDILLDGGGTDATDDLVMLGVVSSFCIRISKRERSSLQDAVGSARLAARYVRLLKIKSFYYILSR